MLTWTLTSQSLLFKKEKELRVEINSYLRYNNKKYIFFSFINQNIDYNAFILKQKNYLYLFKQIHTQTKNVSYYDFFKGKCHKAVSVMDSRKKKTTNKRTKTKNKSKQHINTSYLIFRLNFRFLQYMYIVGIIKERKNKNKL